MDGSSALILASAIVLLALVAAAGIGWMIWRSLGTGGAAAARAESEAAALVERIGRLEWDVAELRSQVQRDVQAMRAPIQRLAEDVRAVAARSAASANSASAAPRPQVVRAAEPVPAPANAPVDVMADYRAAAEDLAGAGEAFMSVHQPIGIVWSADDGGWRADGEPRLAFLWAVRLGREYLILPGYRALKDWRSHFAPQREQNAAEHFGAAFDLDEAPGRFEVAPAVAQADGAVLRLRRRGTIRGFRG